MLPSGPKPIHAPTPQTGVLRRGVVREGLANGPTRTGVESCNNALRRQKNSPGRGAKNRALIAVSDKIVRIIFAMLRDGSVTSPDRTGPGPGRLACR